MLYLAAVAGMIAIFGFTVRSARERGRSGMLWGALSIAAIVVGLVVEVVLMARLAQAGALVLTGIIFVGTPLVCMAAVLGLVWLLPETVPTLLGSSWPMDRLASRDTPAGSCELAFDGRALRVGDVALAPADVTELVADGECVRVSWSGGSVVLLPSGKERTAAERAKQSQAIEKRLRKLMGPPQPRPAEPKPPYR